MNWGLNDGVYNLSYEELRNVLNNLKFHRKDVLEVQGNEDFVVIEDMYIINYKFLYPDWKRIMTISDYPIQLTLTKTDVKNIKRFLKPYTGYKYRLYTLFTEEVLYNFFYEEYKTNNYRFIEYVKKDFKAKKGFRLFTDVTFIKHILSTYRLKDEDDVLIKITDEVSAIYIKFTTTNTEFLFVPIKNLFYRSTIKKRRRCE